MIMMSLKVILQRIHKLKQVSMSQNTFFGETRPIGTCRSPVCIESSRSCANCSKLFTMLVGGASVHGKGGKKSSQASKGSDCRRCVLFCEKLQLSVFRSSCPLQYPASAHCMTSLTHMSHFFYRYWY